MPKLESRFVDFRALKAAVSMEQVLAHYGVLDRFKRGQDTLTGPCPIHNGTNPTQFRVSLSKNVWNCFSQCHCGGNVLDFVVRKEDVSPREAANRLIDWFHLDVDKLTSEVPPEGSRTRRSAAPKSDAPTSQSNGATSPPEAPAKPVVPPEEKEPTGFNRPLGFRLDLDPAHPYLVERGLTPETIDAFGIGFCAKGVMAQRIAIPITNPKGVLVGYAGRWPGETPPAERPKYRMPDGFKKALEIYRFAEAMREPVEAPLVIVEGFFDAMRLWQIGLKKVVALMGSSLSVAQQSLLAQALNPQSRVVIIFDEDEAGRIGRTGVAQQLSLRAYVRVVAFADEGFQAKHLTAEEAKVLGVLPS